MFGLGLVFLGTSARADLAQIKAYKEAFSGTTPKCISCHVTEHPKKEDGQHDPNDYGKAVIKAAKSAGVDKPTADTYKTAGTIEDFASKTPAAAK